MKAKAFTVWMAMRPVARQAKQDGGLLSYFGYQLKQSGTGSGVKFIKDGSNEVKNFHKPHPDGILKRYVLEQVIEKLRKDGLL